MAKYALIINGDTEARHLQNVERSLENKFEAEDYETYVTSPQKPKAPHDHYIQPTLENIQQLIFKLKAKIGANDELVIYTTGNGNKEGEAGRLCLQGRCDYKTVAPLLDAIRYGQRTVIMDQSFSGNWNKVFMDNPKTLFMATGSKNEEVCCQEIAPKLWDRAVNIPDLNKDGVVSWQERYAYAATGVTSSEPQFVVSPGYRLEGRAVFATRVVEVKDEKELTAQLSKLTPGQYAVITFATDWCDPCQEYKPLFNRMAETGGGQHLWIWTESEALAAKWNVSGYPTVMVVNGHGQRRIIEEKKDILEELASFEVPQEERALTRLERSIAAAEKIEDADSRSWAFRKIASRLAEAGLVERALSIFKKSIAAAEKIEDTSNRSWVFRDIAFWLAEAGFGERSLPIFKQLIAAAEKIENADYRYLAFRWIASELAEAGHRERALSIFKKSIAAAEKIEYAFNRSWAFQEIALVLAEAGLGKRALPILERSLAAAEKIEDADSRSWTFRDIASVLAKAGHEKRALSIFKKSIATAKKIEDDYYRSWAFEEIASTLEQMGLADRLPLPQY